ncbi:MAG TPA: protein-L-isoaspartate O-methyltransferase [Dermatophilaceae bacterium]|nr:protein-L-isoaspartate O-methyltransferase [Dermatophilaceae bacterium]
MDEAVAAALAAHPRADFLPDAARYRADVDGPIQIGRGQTCSQPRTVASMLELLAVRAGHHALDVGSGSGWTTALLAHLVGPGGSVVGVEIEPDLVAFGSANLAARGTPWASIRQARPGALGAPEDAPFDRILVSADADDLPEALVDQLADGGRMVIPVDGWMTLVVKEGGAVRTSRHGPYRFVPLR